MAKNLLNKETSNLEALARTRFGTVTAAELKLVRAAPSGEIAWCGPSQRDDDPRNDPSQADTWNRERQIRAGLIRWLCVDRSARAQVDPQGIYVHGAKIVDELELSFIVVPFPLRLWRCALMSDVNLHSVGIPELDFSGSWVASLDADGASVKGSVFLRNEFRALGEVRLQGAEIGTVLDCEDGTFTNPQSKEQPGSGEALNANGIMVKGSVLLSGRFRAEGRVQFMGATIGQDVDCSSATFINPPRKGLSASGTAFAADGIHLDGSMFLSGLHAEGGVGLVGAQIGGDLGCEQATFMNPLKKDLGGSGAALLGDRASVKGSAFFRFGFQAEGCVCLPSARIGGALDCRRGVFAALDLTNASAGSILDDEGSWPERGRLDLDGFFYGRISDGPKDAKSRLRWLGRQPERPFRPQPYVQLARILREAGDDDGARQVLVAMEDRRWDTTEDHHWTDPLQKWPLRVTVGYGYRPLRALWEVVGLSALGWIIYRRSYLAGSMVPSEKEAYQSFEAEGQLPLHYRRFAPLVYSI